MTFVSLFQCFSPFLYYIFWDRQFTDHLLGLISTNLSVTAATWTEYSYITLKSPAFWWMQISFLTILHSVWKIYPQLHKNSLFAAKAFYSSREFLSNCVEVFIESNPYSSSRQLISSSKAWAHLREIWSSVLHHTKRMCFAKNGNALHICHCIPYTVWETKSLVWDPPMLLRCRYRHNMHSFLFRKNLICPFQNVHTKQPPPLFHRSCKTA